MKSFLYHVEINISDTRKSFPFYKDLLGLLGYKVTHDSKWALGMSNETTDLWLIQTTKRFLPKGFHRKNIGLNHIALGVSSKRDVDDFVKKFLRPRKIKPLYQSPKEFPEYVKGYYAVFFEDPDRIKLEVTYIPGFEKRT